MLMLIFVPLAQAGSVDLGISIGDRGLEGFHLSMGDYYRVPEREVVYVRERHIPDPEIPVILFIASRARVRPAYVVELRLRGFSYMDIMGHYHLSPEILYVPVGPPHGHAYGHFKKHKKEWKHMRFRDHEVVDLVNFKFISEHHHMKPEQVLRMRSEGKSFAAIDAKLREKRKERGGEKFREAENSNPANYREEGDRGRGHGHDRDEGGGRGRGKGHGKR